MLLVGVLWVLPKLPLALLFSEGAGWLETGCRLVPEKGQPGKHDEKVMRKRRWRERETKKEI